MSTSENLAAAFAGESQANRKYTAFARKAEAEGLKQVAKLFRAAAEAETVHALAHFRVMGGIKSTLDNLEAAIAGEDYEATKMYPGFLTEAEKAANNPAIATFKNALAVEKVHFKLYTDALAAVRGGKDLPAGKIYVCAICGQTVLAEAPDKCDVCGAGKEKFSEVL